MLVRLCSLRSTLLLTVVGKLRFIVSQDFKRALVTGTGNNMLRYSPRHRQYASR